MKIIYKNTKLSPFEITNIIDSHFDSEVNFLFVADKKLAEYICNYVLNTYEMFDEDMELNDSIKEYYISMYFSEDEDCFYCENARVSNGEFKFNEVFNDEHIDYFVCVQSIDEDVVQKKLTGENGTWTFAEVVWDEEKDCEDDSCQCDVCKYSNNNCDDCKYENSEKCCGECENEVKNSCECEECRDIVIVEEFVEKIESREWCSECLREMIYDLFVLGKQIGWNDCKDMMREVMDEVLKE